MLQFYVNQFLRQSLGLLNHEITLYLNCYLGNGLSQEEIEEFWLKRLNLPRSCLRTVIMNAQPTSSQQRGRKLLYGICEIDVNSTRIVQQVFGAIQEYSGIDNPEWLD